MTYSDAGLVACKVTTAGLIISAIVSICTHSSMNIDCLSMMSINSDERTCFRKNTRRLTTHGAVRLLVFGAIALSPVPALFTTPGAGEEEPFTCVVVDEQVLNYEGRMYFAVCCILTFTFNIVCMLFTLRKLNKTYAASNTLKGHGQVHTSRIFNAVRFFKRSNQVHAAHDDVTISVQISAQQALKPTEAIANQEQGPSTSKPRNIVWSTNTSKHTGSTNAKTISSSQRQVLLLMVTATVLFTICYSPFVASLFLYMFCPQRCGLERSILGVCAVFTVLHGIFNIVVYVVRSREIRRKMMKRLSWIFGKKFQVDSQNAAEPTATWIANNTATSQM